MLYAVRTGPRPSRFGFIVSKAVGNAVTRNLVKRRLREAAAFTVRDRPAGLDVVVRALPASARASWAELSNDYKSALGGALRRLERGTAEGKGPDEGAGTGERTERERTADGSQG
ncbi:hypothetical protein GCM10027449_00660 [Sinomonas notoginsengisoli]